MNDWKDFLETVYVIRNSYTIIQEFVILASVQSKMMIIIHSQSSKLVMILTIVYHSGHFRPTSSAASIILRGRHSSHAHTTISQSTVDDDTASKGYVEQPQPHSCRNIEASRSISCAKASCCLGEAVFEATDSPPLKRLGRPYEGQNSHEV